MTIIGKYAQLAYRHMEIHQPKLFARLKSDNTLAAHLDQVQEQAANLVEQRILAIKETIPVELNNGMPSYQSLLVREETARMLAENEILPQIIYLEPEPESL